MKITVNRQSYLAEDIMEGLTPAEKRKIMEDKARYIILGWRNKGNSFSEIAKELNEQGVTTSTGGEWCKQTVHRKFYEWIEEER